MEEMSAVGKGGIGVADWEGGGRDLFWGKEREEIELWEERLLWTKEVENNIENSGGITVSSTIELGDEARGAMGDGAAPAPLLIASSSRATSDICEASLVRGLHV